MLVIRCFCIDAVAAGVGDDMGRRSLLDAAVADGLNCCLMLRPFLCNWAFQSGHLKNNEATSQLAVNYWLDVQVLDRSFEVRQICPQSSQYNTRTSTSTSTSTVQIISAQILRVLIKYCTVLDL